MKSALLWLAPAFTASLLIVACAEADTDPATAPVDTTEKQPNTTLPAPSNSGSTDAGIVQSTSSSSSGDVTDAGNTTPPACNVTDPAAMMSKMTELMAQAPCDSTCNPTTHCCLDISSLLGGLGGGGGGGLGGLGGLFEGGLPFGGSSGGLGGGACVSQ